MNCPDCGYKMEKWVKGQHPETKKITERMRCKSCRRWVWEQGDEVKWN